MTVDSSKGSLRNLNTNHYATIDVTVIILIFFILCRTPYHIGFSLFKLRGTGKKTSLLINNTMELTTQNLSLLNISQRLSGVEI